MDFSLSEEQEMLRRSVREFLERECPKSKVRELEEDEKGYDPETWHKMAQQLGLMGLVFPQEYGGAEGNFMDLVILVELRCYQILALLFFSTVIFCAIPILEYGSSEQKKEFLPQIVNGETIWVLALTEPSLSYKASGIKVLASSQGEKYLLKGTKLFVSDAHIADYLLVIARTSKFEEGLTAFIADAKSPGINVEIIPTIAHDKQCQVDFDNVIIPKNNILGGGSQGWDIVNFILPRATILKCAEVMGGCQAVLEMTTTYAKDRIQFGRPIGSFQALHHRVVDLFIDIEGLRYLVYEAAWEISVGSLSNLHISMAKAKANEVYQRTCIEGIRVHGAIGFTADHDIGLYFRRIKAAEFALGDTDFHRERIAMELGI